MRSFLFDTHFHLDLIPDGEKAKAEILNNGIYTIAVTNLPDLFMKEVTSDSKYIKHALGFHPELVSKHLGQKEIMWKLLPHARYIGEVGLDFSNGFERDQEVFFRELIEKIIHEKKILTIHSRKAISEVLDIIGNDFSFKPILHWYSGGVKELSTAVTRGYYISVNHKMVNTHKFVSMIKYIPVDRLLLETYLPFSDNGLSHSNALSFTIEQLSRLYKIDRDAMQEQLSNNFRNILS